ncbi:MAG: response regulator [Deltaproteobacteria bacterium]|nr:MAG: response regulator [Deltaproteobacteria bacterium]
MWCAVSAARDRPASIPDHGDRIRRDPGQGTAESGVRRCGPFARGHRDLHPRPLESAAVVDGHARTGRRGRPGCRRAEPSRAMSHGRRGYADHAAGVRGPGPIRAPAAASGDGRRDDRPRRHDPLPSLRPPERALRDRRHPRRGSSFAGPRRVADPRDPHGRPRGDSERELPRGRDDLARAVVHRRSDPRAPADFVHPKCPREPPPDPARGGIRPAPPRSPATPGGRLRHRAFAYGRRGRLDDVSGDAPVDFPTAPRILVMASQITIDQRPARILLVEDDELVSSALRMALVRCGYEVQSATDVEQALELFERHRADVVVTDLIMPGRSGLELLQEVDARDPLVPVIIVTADDSVEAAAEAVRERAFDYLTKPVSRGELRTTIARALEVRRAQLRERTVQARLLEENRQLSVRAQHMAQLLTVLFDRAREGIVVFDEDGHLINASDSFVGLVGSPLGELLGCDADMLFEPHPVAGRFHERIRGLVAGADPTGHWRGQATLRSSSGERLPVRLSLSLCEVESQDDPTVPSTYVVGLLHYDAAHEETQQHLQRADRLATMAVLAGSAAHEIKNDLGPILGYLAMIERSHPDDGLVRMVRHMRESVRRVQDQVEQILAPLRPRVVARGPVVLAESIQTILEMLRRAGRMRRVELVEDIDERVVVHADKDEVHQIGMNLLLNALDALGDAQGGHRGRIFVGVFRDRSLGRLVVQDTGCGIPEEVRQRIFDPFFTTKGDAGTGLGLPVIHEITRSLGGRILVDTQLGAGTRFEVHLPLYRG